MPGRDGVVVLLGALALLGCSSSTPPGGTSTAPPTSPPATTAASPSPSTTSATATAAAPATLAGCPPATAAGALPVLHRAGAPDDLAGDGSGGLWISDTAAGTVTHLDAGGAVRASFGGFSSPEGMVVLPDGAVLVAEQGRDRIVELTPTGQRSVFAALPAHPSSVEGLDGIGFGGGRVLIPDSPHGSLLTAPQNDGARRSTLVPSGLGRPVGAAEWTDGAVYVTAENAAPRGLLRVDAGGAVTTVGNLRQLDDIIVAAGLLYVTDLADGTLLAASPASGESRVLVTGIGQPQGLAALPDGRLAIADSSTGRVIATHACE